VSILIEKCNIEQYRLEVYSGYEPCILYRLSLDGIYHVFGDDICFFYILSTFFDKMRLKYFTAPSFISGAFAAMGMIAGMSGHAVRNADHLIGKPTEEKKEVLFERPEYKKADDYLSIQVQSRCIRIIYTCVANLRFRCV
jgi:hypothetical protein